MKCLGKNRLVQKSTFPLGFKTQEEWEKHAGNRYAQYAWRLLVLDKEISETEYQHMQIRLYLAITGRHIALPRRDQNTFR